MSAHIHPDIKRGKGFTIVEISIALAIVGILLMVGLPSLMSSVTQARANSVPEFYMDGLRRAQSAARKYNVNTRLVLTANAGNGQYDWQIDFCAPISTTPCSDISGTWSTPGTPISTNSNPPQMVTSIVGSAQGLPKADTMTPVLSGGDTDVYFSSSGWLNTRIAGTNLTTIRFNPSISEVLPVQVSITLAGTAERCYPTITDTSDPRSCP